MDLEENLLRVRREARISELELWLAMMVVLTGDPNGSGYQLRVKAEDVALLRQRLPASRPTVEIELDLDTGRYILDVL